MRCGFKSIKNRWLATFEAEQRAAGKNSAPPSAAETSAAQSTVTPTPPPKSACHAQGPSLQCVGSPPKLSSHSEKQATVGQQGSDGRLQLQDAKKVQISNIAACEAHTKPERPDRTSLPLTPLSSSDTAVAGQDHTSPAATAPPTAQRSDAAGRKRQGSAQDHRRVDSTQGSKDKTSTPFDSLSRKRRAEALPEGIRRSQQRRGDDPHLPAPDRLVRQTTPIGPASPQRHSATHKPTLGKMKSSAFIDSSVSASCERKAVLASLVTQPGKLRSSPRTAAIREPQKTGDANGTRLPVLQQRNMSHQPQGPDCASNRRPKLRPSAVIASRISPSQKPEGAKAAAGQVTDARRPAAIATASKSACSRATVAKVKGAAISAAQAAATVQGQLNTAKRRPHKVLDAPSPPLPSGPRGQCGSTHIAADLTAPKLVANSSAACRTRGTAQTGRKPKSPPASRTANDPKFKAVPTPQLKLSVSQQKSGTADVAAEWKDPEQLHPKLKSNVEPGHASSTHGNDTAQPKTAPLVKAESARRRHALPPHDRSRTHSTCSRGSTASRIIKSEGVLKSGHGRTSTMSHTAQQRVPTEQQGEQHSIPTGGVPSEACMFCLPAGASDMRSLGSLDLDLLQGKAQLLTTFQARYAMAPDERPCEIVYQDSEGDWMVLHDDMAWDLIATAANVMLTTTKAAH